MTDVVWYSDDGAASWTLSATRLRATANESLCFGNGGSSHGPWSHLDAACYVSLVILHTNILSGVYNIHGSWPGGSVPCYDEPAIVQRPDGEVLINMRADAAERGHARYQSLSVQAHPGW